MADKRVLIVDDCSIDRMILQRAFGKVHGKSIVLREADNAEAAITAIEEDDFDAVFLDINMPGHNGFYVLRSARRKYPSDPPLIFMYSSSDHPDDVSRASEEGATEYICKPVEMAAIEAVVSRCGRRIDEMRAMGRYQ